MGKRTTGDGPDLTVTTAAQELLENPNLDILEEEVADDDLLETQAGDEYEAPEESDDGEEPESPEQPRYRVKVDGEEVEVTFDELTKGYSRQADYTRKAQELAEQRRVVAAENERIRVEREHYVQQLAWAQQQMAATTPKEPDWEKLYQADPVEYVRQKDLWRENRERQQALAVELQRVAMMRQQEQMATLHNVVTEERRKLVESIPDWQDEDKATRDRNAIRSYLSDVGFAAEEIGQIYDHRAVRVAWEAAKYRELMRKQRSLAPSRTASPVAPPGTATSTAEARNKGNAKLKSRLTQTGRIKDAAAYLETLL